MLNQPDAFPPGEQASYQKDLGALQGVLKTFVYLEPKPDSEKH
jgi:hypothetical protein